MTLKEALEKHAALQAEQSAVAKVESEIHDKCVEAGKKLSVARRARIQAARNTESAWRDVEQLRKVEDKTKLRSDR